MRNTLLFGTILLAAACDGSGADGSGSDAGAGACPDGSAVTSVVANAKGRKVLGMTLDGGAIYYGLAEPDAKNSIHRRTAAGEDTTLLSGTSLVASVVHDPVVVDGRLVFMDFGPTGTASHAIYAIPTTTPSSALPTPLLDGLRGTTVRVRAAGGRVYVLGQTATSEAFTVWSGPVGGPLAPLATFDRAVVSCNLAVASDKLWASCIDKSYGAWLANAPLTGGTFTVAVDGAPACLEGFAVVAGTVYCAHLAELYSLAPGAAAKDRRSLLRSAAKKGTGAFGPLAVAPGNKSLLIADAADEDDRNGRILSLDLESGSFTTLACGQAHPVRAVAVDDAVVAWVNTNFTSEPTLLATRRR